MEEIDEKRPWEKRAESLKTRIFFFIAGSIGTMILVIALFANNYYSTEFIVAISVTVGLIILAAIIIVIAINVQKRKQKKE